MGAGPGLGALRLKSAFPASRLPALSPSSPWEGRCLQRPQGPDVQASERRLSTKWFAKSSLRHEVTVAVLPSCSSAATRVLWMGDTLGPSPALCGVRLPGEAQAGPVASTQHHLSLLGRTSC